MNPDELARALRLYLIADPDHCDGDLVAATREALLGGVTLVQLRAKSLSDRELVIVGSHLRSLTRERNVPLIINDRVDIALAVDADGVHLGVNDLHPANARAIAPPPFIIGYSPDDQQDTAGADADYLGIGPVFGTSSKGDAGTALGIRAFSRRIADCSVPVVGIGGVTADNAGDVVRAGADGVAVISAILRDPAPREAARRLLRSVTSAAAAPTGDVPDPSATARQR